MVVVLLTWAFTLAGGQSTTELKVIGSNEVENKGMKIEIPADSTKSQMLEKEENVLPNFLKDCRTICFYGDSLTDGSSYPDYVINTLNSNFPNQSFIIQNSAKCGDTSRDLVRRWDIDITPKKPDLVIICVGVNDMSQNIPFEEFQNNLNVLISKAKKIDSKVMMVLTSHCKPELKDKKLISYVKIMRRIALEHQLPFADAYHTFKALEKENKVVLGPDGLHHGPDGFPAMARAILDGMGLPSIAVNTKIKPWPYALTNWEISNNIAHNKNTTLSDWSKKAKWIPYPTEKALNQVEWWDKPFIQRGAVLPNIFNDKEGHIVLAKTIYSADTACNAELQIGGSAPLTILFNQKIIWNQTKAHGYHPNADRITIKLEAGDNEFIVHTKYLAYLNLIPNKKE